MPKCKSAEIAPKKSANSTTLSIQCLIDRCWEFVDQNIYSVMQSDQFLQIDRDLLAELLGRNELKMSHKRGYSDRGELSLWRAVSSGSPVRGLYKKNISKPKMSTKNFFFKAC